MVWFLTAFAILLAGGLVSLVLGKSPTGACLIGVAGALLGGGMVLLLSIWVLVSGQSQSLRLAWPLPLGSANMEIDPLSAVFAAAIALVTMAGGGLRERVSAAAGRKNLGVSWFFFNLLAASMLLVVVAPTACCSSQAGNSCRSLRSSS